MLLSPAAPSFSASFAGTTCCDRCLLRIGARSVATLHRAGAALALRSALPTALDRCWAEAAAVMCYFVLPSLSIARELGGCACHSSVLETFPFLLLPPRGPVEASVEEQEQAEGTDSLWHQPPQGPDVASDVADLAETLIDGV